MFDFGLDHCQTEFLASDHSTTSFGSDNPIENEHVIFLPGGKVMVVDWGLQSFAKTAVSITIAGVVAAGAAVAAVLWADARAKRRRAVIVQRNAPQPEIMSDDELDEEGENSDPN